MPTLLRTPYLHPRSVLSSRALIAIVRRLQTRQFFTTAVSAALSGAADGVSLPTCHYNTGQEMLSQWKRRRHMQPQGM